MKTSSTQYEMLITFMEHHGDLSKPTKCLGGRVANLQKWCELVNLLNSDSTGDTKSDVKWKKVWSDFKNNTKRKAARLHQASIGTGGPAIHAKLSELEKRVLAVIRTQAATNLSGETEAGFAEPNPLAEREPQHTTDSLSLATTNEDIEVWESSDPSSCSHTAPTPQIHPTQVVEVTTRPETPQQWPSQHAAHLESAPSPSGETRRRHGRRLRGAPMRRSRTRVNRGGQYYLGADEEWRKFKMEQHREWVEIKREQNRIREMELENQKVWQNLCQEAMGLFKDFLNKK